jgi:hypothetical protein
MKIITALITIGVVLMASQAGADDKTVTTTVRNGNSIATVTQSGDPATTVKKVEKRPGYTRIEQQTGNSRSVVVQSSNPADMAEFEKDLPPELRDMFKMFGK